MFMLFLCNIANVVQRTFKIVQKLRSRECNELYPQEHRTYVNCAHARVPKLPREVPRDVSRKLAADSVCENGVVEVSLLHV